MAIVRRPRADIDLSTVDWAALEAVSEARIEAQINADEDTAPLFTDDELARARRVQPSVAPAEINIRTPRDATHRALCGRPAR